MKLSEILRAGKQRIETLGWCQGDEKAMGHDGKLGYCTATAMCDGDLKSSLDAIGFLKKVNGIDDKAGIFVWNDAPERTKEDVIAAYDKAIAEAELNGI